MTSFEVLLKEYELLRDEFMESFKARNQILSYGLASISVCIAGSAFILTGGFQAIASLLLYWILPSFILTILFSLTSEIEKIQVIGDICWRLN